MKKLSFCGFLLIACIIALAVSFVACNETVLTPAETIPEIIETDIATITPETTVAPETTSVPETTGSPHEHVWSEWSITLDATCTAAGEKERTCTCGEKETMAIFSLGHTEVIDSAVDPDCTASGLTEGKHCSVCNTVLLAQNSVPAIGHNISVVNTKAATCSTEGYTGDAICTRCTGTVETGVNVPILPHDEILIQGEVSTYNIQGTTPGAKCKVCGNVTREQEVLPLLEYTPSAEEMEFLNSINKVRAEHSVPPVEFSSRIYEVALVRISEIAVQMSHTRPNGERFSTAFNEVGCLCVREVGENLGDKGYSVENLMTAFMNSPSHKKVILNDIYDHVGIAVEIRTDGRLRVVMLFGHIVS